MKKPRIGIAAFLGESGKRYQLGRRYVDAVRRAGGLPVLIVPDSHEVAEWVEGLDGLLLPGGGDIDPKHYGGRPHPAIYDVDPVRDDAELALARAAKRENLPLLAVCRGSQVVNVALGGTLHEHLPDVVGTEVLHRLPAPEVSSRHKVQAAKGSLLAKTAGRLEFEVVSRHHQGIKDVAPGLAAVARAPDGAIEALEDESHRWLLAVQWHPELSAETDPVQQRLFDALVRSAGAEKR